jgi:hypothetical protein
MSNSTNGEPNDTYTNLSLINPDEIEENLVLYKPKYKVGDNFIINGKKFIIEEIFTEKDKNKNIQLYKYIFTDSSNNELYKDTAYDIDIFIEEEEMRREKRPPLGGKHKSRRRRKSRKSRKYKKCRKCRK